MTDKELAALRSMMHAEIEAAQQTFRASMHSELKAAQGFSKNGDNALYWFFTKVLTIERALLLALLVYDFGGKAVTMTRDTEQAIETAATATTRTAELSTKVDDLSAYVMSQAANRSDENRATRATVAALEDRVSRTATRQELRDTVQREILPRLNRIEAMTKQIGP